MFWPKQYTNKNSVHVECAHQAGYVLGFDIAPVKGSRRDQVSVVNVNGEVGTMTAAVWCKEHVPTKTIVHQMHDIVDETGINALQLYVQNFKQADLTLTGTVRKATLINLSTKVVNPIVTAQPPNRRVSTANVHSSSSRSHVKVEEAAKTGQDQHADEKTCTTCGVHLTPKWWPYPDPKAENQASAPLVVSIETNGDSDMLNNNSQPPPNPAQSSENNLALAAAALHRNPTKPEPVSTEVQCHQCHWKKVKKEPTPVSPPPPPPAPIASVAHQEASQLPVPVAAAASVSVPNPEDEAVNIPAHYAWPQPPSYPQNGSYTSWRRSSPIPQNAPIHNSQLNGIHSPPNHHGQVENSLSSQNSPPAQAGHAYMRQPTPSFPQSPRQNGHMPQISNGYPPSPQRMSSSGHLPNGTYPSFASARHPTHHLTNGGPPPRAPDYSLPRLPPTYGGPPPTSPPLPREPYHQGREPSPASHPSMRPLHSEYPAMNVTRNPPPFGTAHGSPPLAQDSRYQGREPYGTQNNDRTNERRVNGGGASASPSVRNLLS